MSLMLGMGHLHLHILSLQIRRDFAEMSFQILNSFVQHLISKQKNLGFLILLERFQSPDLHAEECALFAVFATP